MEKEKYNKTIVSRQNKMIVCGNKQTNHIRCHQAFWLYSAFLKIIIIQNSCIGML